MTKFAEWGRWGAAAYLAFRAMFSLREMIAALPKAWRDPGNLSHAVDYFGLGISLLFLLCAWGIVRWRKWAHGTAVTLVLVEIVFFLVVIIAFWPVSFFLGLAGHNLLLWPLLDLPVFVWLVMPDVRSAYWQQPEMACTR